MKIEGIQKLTLLDYPEKIACTIFLGGCNLRCPFCHNSELIHIDNNTDGLQLNEVMKFLRSRVCVLEGVAITGGEPLINKDIESLLLPIKEMGYPIKLDTNGCYPDLLQEVIDKKLVDYVAMDVKNSLKEYPRTVGVKNFDTTNIVRSINILLEGKVDYEFRTTIVNGYHNEQTLMDIVPLIKNCSKYYLQSFVDSGEVLDKSISGYHKDLILGYQKLLKPYFKHIDVRGV